MSSTASETTHKPQLPPNLASELWQRHAAQERKKLANAPTPVNSTAEISPEDRASFTEHLKSSTRVLALVGAGLSAASGIPTFRGAGGFWREYDCMTLATPRAFAKDPALVWQFYNYRRHCALVAEPNRAHVALAELAKKKPGFLAISQNIDGLCQRAGHPPENIQSVHGSLFSSRCTECAYVEHDNFADPLVPAFELPEHVDAADAKFPLKPIPLSALPRCPACRALLRPDVVWFGESLAVDAVARVDAWVRGDSEADGAKIDLMLVVGTSALVYPAAGYIHAARARGARIAVFNMEQPEEEGSTSRLKEGDWFFQGDASKLLPELLKEVVGEIS
ncbi:putative SIR2 family histone deacetylase [Mycena belliarum]|uniref:SIR2 family histone deacetylase n=1 Tax=Mycena belliarum TaxID=1033014 RepID=A0AAD6XHL2_9AGAR|nr:putative SIR2 family histone deacetylase [Mycena belliae]